MDTTELEFAALRKRIAELQEELQKCRKIITENELDEEIAYVSDEEAICVSEISKLKTLSDTCGLSKEEVQMLDILYKNLRLIRGMDSGKAAKKAKPKSKAELFQIVQGK